MILYLKTCESTMTEARAWAKAGAPHLATVQSDEQTAGRGRRGRAWQSEFGTGLYFTTILKINLASSFFGLLPLAVGVAVCNLLQEFGVSAKLKWPNDVLLNNKKLAGILVERDATTNVFLVGVGVNLRQPKSSVVDAASLDDVLGEHVPDKKELLNKIIAQIDICSNLLLQNPEGILQAWRSNSAVLGQQVRILQENQNDFTGIAEDISQDGALFVRVNADLVAVHAGDVSLRLI